MNICVSGFKILQIFFCNVGNRHTLIIHEQSILLFIFTSFFIISFEVLKINQIISIHRPTVGNGWSCRQDVEVGVPELVQHWPNTIKIDILLCCWINVGPTTTHQRVFFSNRAKNTILEKLQIKQNARSLDYFY